MADRIKEVRAINAEPWEPLPSMVKRQCRERRYFFSTSATEEESLCPDCTTEGTKTWRPNTGGLDTLRHVVAAALVIATMTGPAFAVSIGGVGLETCGTWVADHEADPPLRAWQDEQWMIGYLSGAGKWGSTDLDPLNGMDARAIYDWISNYCAANPFAQIQDAGNAFIHVHPQ